MKYTIYTDASYDIEKTGIGAVLYNDEKKRIAHVKACVIPTGSNKVKNITAAEVKAVFLGIRMLTEKCNLEDGDKIIIHVDNEAVVRIMAGDIEVPAAIKRVIKQLRAEMMKIPETVTVNFVKEGRENNSVADALAFAARRNGF